MSKVFVPYNLTMEIDVWFKSTTNVAFTSKEFYNVVLAIEFAGSVEKQNNLAELFKTLQKDEVIRRAAFIVKLSNLLKTISSNRKYDLSCSSAT